MVSAMSEKRQHGGIIRPLAVHRQRAEMALTKFHLDQRVGERAKTHTAMFGRYEWKPQALRPRFLAQIGNHRTERFAIRQPFFGWDTFILDPLPDPRTDLFCIIRNYKIDRHDRLLLGLFCCRQTRALHRLLEDPFIVGLFCRARITTVGKVVQGIFDNARSV